MHKIGICFIVPLTKHIYYFWHLFFFGFSILALFKYISMFILRFLGGDFQISQFSTNHLPLLSILINLQFQTIFWFRTSIPFLCGCHKDWGNLGPICSGITKAYISWSTLRILFKTLMGYDKFIKVRFNLDQNLSSIYLTIGSKDLFWNAVAWLGIVVKQN